MRRQASRLIDRLLLHRLHKFRVVAGIARAGKAELLPNQKPALVAQRIEVVGLIQPAAPDPQQVKIRFLGKLNELGVPGLVDPRKNEIRRHEVRALGKNFCPVDLDDEVAAFLRMRPLGELDGTEADPGLSYADRLASGLDLDFDVVERLAAIAAWPPEVEAGDMQFNTKQYCKSRISYGKVGF